MREHYSGVEDGSVDDVERAEIILQSVTHQDGVGIDEAHQVILHLLYILVTTSHWK